MSHDWTGGEEISRDDFFHGDFDSGNLERATKISAQSKSRQFS